jgi:hypothetical protein
MLRRLGQPDAAEAAFERAAHLAATEKDRRFLVQQIEELADEAALIQPPGESTGSTKETGARGSLLQ